MINKIRETTIPLGSYLESVKEGDISEDQDVQRRFCSDNPFVNGIAVTVATGDYLPPIILGEISVGDDMFQSYIIDGNQRTAALLMIRYGNYRITSSIEDNLIEYQSKVLDKNGKVQYTDDGAIVWEQKTFDIKNKTYDEFPPEIQKKFDRFQLRVVTHQNCVMKDLSRLVRRYNNHKSMNTSQKALTYLDSFARKAKFVSQNNNFFKDTIKYSEAECRKGTYERCICECVMTIKYLKNWKQTAKNMTKFLNDNANAEDFNLVEEYATRMNKVCDDNFQDIFVLKNIAVWFKAFDTFIKFGLSDERFSDFLTVFRSELHSKKVLNNLSFDIVEEDKHTKNTKIIHEKIEVIEELMKEYFNIVESSEDDINNNETDIISNTLNFLKQSVNSNIEEDDIEFYEESLDDYLVEIPEDSKVLEPANTKSMIAMCAYSYDADEDLGEWLVDYVKRNDSYVFDQKQNFLHMKDDFDKFFGINKKQDIA